MPKGVQGQLDSQIHLLSAVQVETLRLVFEHKNSKEIARIMDVSPHTVDERVRRSLKKLNASNRIEAATILARNGVFDQVTPYQSLRYQSISLVGNASGEEAGAGHGLMWRRFDADTPFSAAPRPAGRRGSLEGIIKPILFAMATVLAFSVLYVILVGLGHLLS